MLILILINVQYLQNVVFSFENSLNRQIHSLSDSYHLLFPPTRGISPIFNAIWTTLMGRTFQTPKILHNKRLSLQLIIFLILNFLTNRSSYEAKKLCEKPSSKALLLN